MKTIIISAHAEKQMSLRGASLEEIYKTVLCGNTELAKNNRLHSMLRFDFNSYSTVNNKYYNFKTIDVIFVEEETEIIVVTVKVYYH